MLPVDALPRVLIVMPAYNEEACVGTVVRDVHRAVPHAEVVVVDDGSSDGTARSAADAGATVLVLPFNLGVGGAMRAGYRYAQRQDADVAVQVDADGQHDPREVERLVGELASCNIVIGARFAGAGDYKVRGPRRWAMRLLSLVLSRFAGTRLTDTTSGFRAVDRLTIAFFAREYPAEYLGDTVESLVMATRAGLTVRQVPVHMRPRVAGNASQSPVRAALYLVRALFALGLAVIRSRHVLPDMKDVRADSRAEPSVRAREE